MSLSTSMQKITDYFWNEISGIQAGRASKWLVENIKAETSYGFMPIGQLGNITLPDSQTIKIEVRDKSSLSSIEKAIYDSNSGLTPQNPAWYILIKVPILTNERREQLKKQVSKISEDIKARLRMARQDEIKSIKKEFEEKLISEDDKKAAEKEVDEITKKFNETVDSMVKAKHEEISI